MKLQEWSRWAEQNREWILDLIRIYLGVGLLIKGISFAVNPAQLALPQGAEWLQPFVPLAPVLHIAGGILLTLGILTRIAALIQLPVVFTAVFLINLPQMRGLQAREVVEFSSLVLFLLVLFTIRGAGPLSLEHYWKREKPLHSRAQALSSRADLFLDAIRIYLGLGLIIKGFYIMGHREELLQVIGGNTGQSIAMILAVHYVIPAHLAGGLLLLLGLGTRGAAIVQLPLLVGAVFYVYLPRLATVEMRQNFEFAALVLFLLVVFSFVGSGRFSLDQAMNRERSTRGSWVPAHA